MVVAKRRFRGETTLDRAVVRELSIAGQEIAIDSPHTSWFVNAAGGSDSNTGRSWAQPFLTMAKAFTQLSSGDTINFSGKIREQISTPANVFGITVRGAGTRPRHIDGTPILGSEVVGMWTTPASPVTTTPLVIVQQQGWRFENILFAGPSAASCVQLLRNAVDGGDLERDGSHAEFHNCRFASGVDGIEQSGGCGHVGVYDCFFTSLTGFAIKNTTGAGFGYPIRWVLKGNRFLDNANVLKMACIGWHVEDNDFMTTTTEVFDTDAGDAAAGKNVVINNRFNVAAASFQPSGNVEGNSTDVWTNVLADVIETGVPA